MVILVYNSPVYPRPVRGLLEPIAILCIHLGAI